MKEEDRLQTTQHTSDKAVTEVLSNCYANCVDTSRLQQWGPEIPFFGNPAIRTRWMAGTVPYKSGRCRDNSRLLLFALGLGSSQSRFPNRDS